VRTCPPSRASSSPCSPRPVPASSNTHNQHTQHFSNLNHLCRSCFMTATSHSNSALSSSDGVSFDSYCNVPQVTVFQFCRRLWCIDMFLQLLQDAGVASHAAAAAAAAAAGGALHGIPVQQKGCMSVWRGAACLHIVISPLCGQIFSSCVQRRQWGDCCA